MDEIDSIGMNRGGSGSGGMMMGGMIMGGGSLGLNTLLNQMDSLGDLVEDRWRYKILRWFGLVRGPVNEQAARLRHRRDEPARGARSGADPARPARPDARGPRARRRGPARHHPALPRRRRPTTPTIAIEMMVADSMGWTPIMIKTIINEALIKAHDDGREFLTYKDWLDAADERALGLKQPIRSMAPDRPARDRLPRGRARGRRALPPAGEPRSRRRRSSGAATRSASCSGGARGAHTRHARQIETDIMVSLGSRAVEEVILETKMAGAVVATS